MITAEERRAIIKATVDETLRRTRAITPAMRYGVVTLDETTENVSQYRVLLDGDAVGDEVICPSLVGPVAEGARVQVMWVPPHETVIAGVVNGAVRRGFQLARSTVQSMPGTGVTTPVTFLTSEAVIWDHTTGVLPANSSTVYVPDGWSGTWEFHVRGTLASLGSSGAVGWMGVNVDGTNYELAMCAVGAQTTWWQSGSVIMDAAEYTPLQVRFAQWTGSGKDAQCWFTATLRDAHPVY